MRVEWQAGSVRTEHGGDEDNGGEENVSLHIESFVREKKLLDYLYGRNLCHTDPFIIIKIGEKYLTSRQTKSSSGSVVNMFNPKENRAMLIRVSFSGYIADRDQIATRGEIFKLTGEKLLSMLPCVRSVNTTYPDIAIMEHATNDAIVDTCVTVANRSIVGVLKLP